MSFDEIYSHVSTISINIWNTSTAPKSSLLHLCRQSPRQTIAMATSDLISFPMGLLCSQCHISGITHYVDFLNDWIHSISMILWRFMHVGSSSSAFHQVIFHVLQFAKLFIS